jgi:amino acid transporter
VLAAGVVCVGRSLDNGPNCRADLNLPSRDALNERRRTSKITLIPLVATTYLMVSGGPYGIEELILKCGYLTTVLVLVITPTVWSLPTALMVGELSAAIPEEGGYYAWARRALGPFWGFQQAWLALANSIVDMALYPTLFVQYLGRVWPGIATGHVALAIGWAIIIACAAVNILGIRVVGFVSLGLTAALLLPIAVLAGLALATPTHVISAATQTGSTDVLGGILIAMWSYSGWEEASTIASEVDRPQRNYPIVMLGVLVLAVLVYTLPVLAIAHWGFPATSWANGSWIDVGKTIGGPLLGSAILIAGLISSFAICNALVLSYSRLPVALADNGYLPRMFRLRGERNGAPWVSIMVCSLAWGAMLPMGFDRLIAIDVMLYGLCLSVQFISLVVLRIKEPDLPRPFRVPGGKWGVSLAGVAPVLLLLTALYHECIQPDRSFYVVAFGGGLVALGPVFYLLASWYRARGQARQQSD